MGRTVSEPAEGGNPGATLPDVIQTSAAINPGNSGGALVDLSGSVIGVPTLAAVDPQIGGGSPAPGIGFRHPQQDRHRQRAAAHRHRPGHQLAPGGVRDRAVTVVDTSGRPAGAGVESVEPGGPAAAAGIRPGEVITAVHGAQVHTAHDLAAAPAGLRPGQSVPVQLADPNGSTRTVTVTLCQLQP